MKGLQLLLVVEEDGGEEEEMQWIVFIGRH